MQSSIADITDYKKDLLADGSTVDAGAISDKEEQAVHQLIDVHKEPIVELKNAGAKLLAVAEELTSADNKEGSSAEEDSYSESEDDLDLTMETDEAMEELCERNLFMQIRRLMNERMHMLDSILLNDKCETFAEALLKNTGKDDLLKFIECVEDFEVDVKNEEQDKIDSSKEFFAFSTNGNILKSPRSSFDDNLSSKSQDNDKQPRDQAASAYTM